MGRILVTGGAGFIGSHLVDELIKRGTDPNRIVVIDNFSTGLLANVHPEVKVLDAPLNGIIIDNFVKVLQIDEIDEVYHIAAIARVQPSYKDPNRWIRNNVDSTANLLEVCRLAGIKKIINASSSTVSYMNNGSIGGSRSLTKKANSPYSVSKYLGEEICKLYRDSYDMNIVSLRYFSVYGEKMDLSEENSTVIPRIFRSIIRNEPFYLYGSGDHRRDFTHIDDIVDGTIRAMEKLEHLHCDFYELGSTDSIRIKDLLKVLPDLQIENVKAVEEIPVTISDSSSAHYAFGYKKTKDVREWLKYQVNENMDYWKERLKLYEN